MDCEGKDSVIETRDWSSMIHIQVVSQVTGGEAEHYTHECCREEKTVVGKVVVESS